jgi:hypothetical protein
MAKEDDTKENTSTFTVDHETSDSIDMPSVTKLLNRKSLGLKKSPPSPQPVSPVKSDSNTQPKIPPPSVKPPLPVPEPSHMPSSGIEISITASDAPTTIEIETSSSPVQSEPSTPTPIAVAPPRIQRAQRKATRSIQPLIIWEVPLLESGADPLGKGIAIMLKRGATQALFLSITPPPSGSPVPHFVSTATVLPGTKLNLWTGLKWDPTVVPEMWNFFVKSGQVELSPPGTRTNQSSHRNVVRAAFGVLQTEWLLLVRVGTANACRGVVAFTSLQSLLTQLDEALPLLTTSATKT